MRAAFTQRRKTIRNSLLGSGWPTETVDRLLAANDIDPKRRGETLSLREFAALSNYLTDPEPTVEQQISRIP